MMALYVAKTSNTAVKVNGIVTAVTGVSSGGTVVEREMEASEISYDTYSTGGAGESASFQFRMILTVPELISETKNVIAVIVDYVVTEDANNTRRIGCLIYTMNGKYNYQIMSTGGIGTDMSSYISLSGDKIIVPLRLGTTVTYPTSINKAIVIYEDLGG